MNKVTTNRNHQRGAIVRFDPAGAVRLSLIINKDQIPALRLFDSKDRPRVLLGADPEGEAALDFTRTTASLLRELQ
jgi:hypothetical protein